MAVRRRGSGIDTRSVLIGLLALVVLAGAVATLLALRSGGRRSDLPGPIDEEPAMGWRAVTPPAWTQSAVELGGVRFLHDGLLVGGLEVTRDGLAAVLPEGARIEATWVAATRWGQAEGYEVTVPLTEPNGAQILVQQLTEAEAQGEAGSATGGRRPEVHCVLKQGSRMVHLWTRENAGFPPQAAASAAVNLLASLEPVTSFDAGLAESGGPAVRLIRVAPATAGAEVSGTFDLQIVVTNGSDEPAVDVVASLGIEGAASPAVQPLPRRTETIGSLQPWQSVTLVAPSVKLPEGVPQGTAFRVHAEIVPAATEGTLPTGGGLELTVTAGPGDRGDTARNGE